MKTLKINTLLVVLVSLVTLHSCVEDDEFSIPDTSVVEPILEGTEIPMSAVVGALSQAQGNTQLDYNNDEVFFNFPTDGTNQYISGFVVSSDEGGNFFEELIIQNAPENPTLGIRVLIDVNPLFVRYEIGRRVFINLNGLVAGISNGVLSIGLRDGDFLGKIPASLENVHIQRGTEIAEIVPLPLDISEFTDDKTNLFIQIQNVQFSANDVLGATPFTFASEQFDQFEGERSLVSCSSGQSAVFATSTFSDFKGLTLPVNNGTVNAVLAKNFFGDAFNLNINLPGDIIFDNPERCGCGLANSIGANSLFEDDFETQSNFNLITGNGWTNFIQEGTEGWEAYTSGGSNASLGISARASSSNSNDASSIAWLITPVINLDNQTGETFSFMTSNSFANGSIMKVLISDDWDGTTQNITSANWEGLVDANIVNDNEFFGNWVSSGDVSLDCLSGTVHIAFVYEGNDINNGNFNGTYELDEIKILSN